MLIQVLIAAGLISVIAVGMASMTSFYSGQQKVLSQKFEILDVTNALSQTMADAAKSTCAIQGKRFNAATSTPTIDVGIVRYGCGATDPIIAQDGQPLPGSTTGLRVNRVQVVNISAIPSNPDEFKGTLQVSFQNSSLKPASAKIQFTTD